MYEQIRQSIQDLDTCAHLMHVMSTQMEGLVNLNAQQRLMMKRMMTGSREDGVEVYSESVLDKPEGN